MIGDSLKDIECALNAGCGHSILVRTGNGNDAEHLLAEAGISADYVAEDLYDASRWIIRKEKNRF